MKALKKVRRKGSLKTDQEGSLKKDQKLNKGLGELSLKDKILKAAEEHPDNEETQALVLQESMSAVDKSNAWNQHQVHLKKKGNESLKKKFDEMDKKGKGLSTALFLLKKNKSLFASVSKGVSQEVSLNKRERNGWPRRKRTPSGLKRNLKSTWHQVGWSTEKLATMSGNTRTPRTLRRLLQVRGPCNTSLGRSMSWRKGMRQSGAKCWKRICTAFCWEALKKAKALPRALALRKAKAKVKPGPNPFCEGSSLHKVPFVKAAPLTKTVFWGQLSSHNPFLRKQLSSQHPFCQGSSLHKIPFVKAAPFTKSLLWGSSLHKIPFVKASLHQNPFFEGSSLHKIPFCGGSSLHNFPFVKGSSLHRTAFVKAALFTKSLLWRQLLSQIPFCEGSSFTKFLLWRQLSSGPFTDPFLSGTMEVFLHVRCIPQQNSQWQFWASVWSCQCASTYVFFFEFRHACAQVCRVRMSTMIMCAHAA